jgi:hypothetical protein
MLKNKISLKRVISLLIILIAAPIVVSCAGPGSGPNTPAGAAPAEHFWQYLYAFAGEEPGFATYSYVLVGRDESNPEAVSRYFRLVKAIQASTNNADEIPAYAPKHIFNLFLIPAKKDAVNPSNQPNFELSKLLLTALSASSPQSFSRPGPYLITLYRPIGFGKKDEVADLLYVDLTDAHPTAIAEIVHVYKSEVLSEPLDGIEKLESFRLSLLNLALIAQDSIGFAKSAYADLRDAFSE